MLVRDLIEELRKHDYNKRVIVLDCDVGIAATKVQAIKAYQEPDVEEGKEGLWFEGELHDAKDVVAICIQEPS